MAVKLRIDAIDRRVDITFPGFYDDTTRSEVLADFARTELEKAKAQNASVLGRDPTYETYVDGKLDAPLNSVKPHGRIVFEFELQTEMFAWIADQLEVHSPVGTKGPFRPGHPGLYRRSHILTADGRLVDLRSVPPAAEEYVFVNILPYARKIERGLSSQAPEGVYQVVATLAQTRWGNVARVRFGYRTPIIGAIHEWAATTKMQTSRRDREEWLRRQPAIIVTLR
jgi:hypothetical protein